MDAMAVFGFFAFLMVIFLWSKVNRLERLLRENGIRPVGSKDLARRLAGMTGLTVTLTLYSDSWDMSGLTCRAWTPMRCGPWCGRTRGRRKSGSCSSAWTASRASRGRSGFALWATYFYPRKKPNFLCG